MLVIPPKKFNVSRVSAGVLVGEYESDPPDAGLLGELWQSLGLHFEFYSGLAFNLASSCSQLRKIVRK
jgi:hypothetical protein